MLLTPSSIHRISRPSKQARWQELLQEYDFVWEHKSSKHNQVEDALSRKKSAKVEMETRWLMGYMVRYALQCETK